MSQKSVRKRKNEIECSQNPINLDTLGVNYETDCVRYILCKIGINIPFTRREIMQNVFFGKPGKNFDVYMKKAEDILKDIYGLNLELIDTDSSEKKYCVSNNLSVDVAQDENNMKILLTFLILAHIFMSKDNSTDLALWKFLSVTLKINDFSFNTELDGIGNLKNFINKTLVKQRYIISENRGGEHENGDMKKRYKWGPRAEKRVSKLEILKFVSKIYNGKSINKWDYHYKEAVAQF